MKRRQLIWATPGILGSIAVPRARAAQPCPPPVVGVIGGGSVSTACPASANPLSALAASMPAGSWAKLMVSNQDTVLGVGPISGSMLHYCNQMPWNPVRKAIEIVGMDHNAGMQRYVRYNAVTNAFEVVQADDGAGTATRHGYGHTVVNPATGDLYHRLAEDHNDGPGPLVRRFAQSGNSWANLARPNTLFYMQIAIAACWWTGSFAGAGAQGCLLIYNSGDSARGGSANDGGIYAYDPLANNWFWSARGMSPFYGNAGATYHSVMAYSARRNVAVYGGGNDNPTKIWRLNADRSVSAMPDTPAGCTLGVQQGILCEDPATGNFLVLSQGGLWELNPTDSGRWTKLSGGRVPPAAVGNPTAPHGVVCTPIRDHGVVAYITQTSSTGGMFHLYKHA
jgi:hypothetical protein